ncbi:MAG: hypothetical protein JWP87_5619 [Labilithrix sp.]|nr:hypothetical protein [Labilithrix sp.]
MTPEARATLRRFLPWTLGGCALAIAWFVYNVTLPPLYKGRICCDSVGYIAIANEASGLWEIFLGVSNRSFGYPLFLGAHKALVQLLGLGTDWVVLSLVTSLVFHIVAVLFLYAVLVHRLKMNVSPAFLLLALAHPGLVSHAALPLTDSLATSISTAAVAFAMWGYEDGLRPRSTMFLQLAAGALLGADIVIRPTFLMVAAATVPIVWLLLPALHHARRDPEKTRGARLRALGVAVRQFALPVVAGLVLASAMAPRNCFAKYHTACIIDPANSAETKARSIRYGLEMPRVWTTFTPPRDRTGWVSDPFSVEHFSSRCTITEAAALTDLARCYARGAPYLPLHLAKKTIGLYDNFHLNTYAADITRPWHAVLNRSFGWLAFLGFVCSIHHLQAVLRKKRAFEPALVVPMAFVLLYTAISINFHIESRYGLPAVVPAFVMAASTLQSASRRTKLLLLACTVPFVVQTFLWDSAPDASIEFLRLHPV